VTRATGTTSLKVAHGIDRALRSSFELDGTIPHYSKSAGRSSADSFASRPAHQPRLQVDTLRFNVLGLVGIGISTKRAHKAGRQADCSPNDVAPAGLVMVGVTWL
jgi:hypothetical protein